MATNIADREKEHFDRLALSQGAVWWGHRTRAGQFRLEQKTKRIARLAAIEPHSKILEIGCGDGDFTKYLANETGASITAVDISPELIKMARDKFHFSNAVFDVADINNLPFENDFFDIVTGNSILHHLDLKKVLPEIKRVLKPGGRLCFSEPNMLNPQVLIEKNIKFIGKLLQNSPDETAFIRWPMASFLKQQGFVNVKIMPADFLHPLTPSLFIRTVSVLGRFLEKTPLIKELAGSLIIYAVLSDKN